MRQSIEDQYRNRSGRKRKRRRRRRRRRRRKKKKRRGALGGEEDGKGEQREKAVSENDSNSRYLNKGCTFG